MLLLITLLSFWFVVLYFNYSFTPFSCLSSCLFQPSDHVKGARLIILALEWSFGMLLICINAKAAKQIKRTVNPGIQCINEDQDPPTLSWLVVYAVYDKRYSYTVYGHICNHMVRHAWVKALREPIPILTNNFQNVCLKSGSSWYSGLIGDYLTTVHIFLLYFS